VSRVTLYGTDMAAAASPSLHDVDPPTLADETACPSDAAATPLAAVPTASPSSLASRWRITASGRSPAGVVVVVAAACTVAGLIVWTIIDPGGVNWGAVSFGLVAAVVALGVALYGLRAVPAQEIAIVAAVAAIATAGRILFASLPNFKPVTFIVLVGGIGFGPSAGFMIGATTALVSNFFFGQGPWTPWQMVAWGAVGFAGGLMGRHGRRPGRWELAIVGGALSLAFGWFMTLWMYITFSAHTWPAFVALYAQGAFFDAAHVAATVLCALLFGPQAVKIVTRYRTRTRVRLLDDPVNDNKEATCWQSASSH
jgi:energy-coupling factor transport system substrate-specific component